MSFLSKSPTKMHVKTKNEHQDPIVSAIPSADQHSRSHKRRRCICLSVIICVVTIGLLILILSLTIFKSKKPITTVNSVVLKDINASISSLIPPRVSINVSLDISISVKNPNKVGIKYRKSSAVLRYKGKNIGDVPIPAGTIGSGDTKQLNLTVTVFVDRFVSDLGIYGDVISGDLPLSTYTRISGKVRILKLFNVRVVSTSTCDLKIDILNRRIANQRCHYKNKL